ncbi:hypothetical protein GLE_0051 [Lysobacter enzymogenes]|uniref:Uncharacterized protein n=1 Tax=Lysobacter enzymogenes TaxID=69 RepID=A0A0S2DA38_LYSEN|nr:hypothetical protein GLE_0051 [Lysobacter enzymogenes]
MRAGVGGIDDDAKRRLDGQQGFHQQKAPEPSRHRKVED